MKFIKQKIKGLYVIKPEPHKDNRGLLRRHFCEKEFKKEKINFHIKQSNISENKKKYTLRGFHFQIPPHGENKVISCVKGSIYDIVVDLRIKSKTYKKWQFFNLTEENRLSIFVPVGCANAYLTMKNNSWILYYHSEFYKKNSERRVRYNDPLFKFIWPNQPLVCSKLDVNVKNYDQI